MEVEYEIYKKALNSKVDKWYIKIKRSNDTKINLLEWFLNSDFLISREWWLNNIKTVLEGEKKN